MENLDFTKEVIELSFRKPVLVDFWAPWCGPCQLLGPVIEELADSAKEKWELVKINTDENQQTANQYNIRSIPAVKLFYKGEIIAEFAGALPKHQIVKWLEENVPDERKTNLAKIREKLDNGDRSEALQELVQFVNKNPDLIEGRIWLAIERVRTEPDVALSLLEDIRLGHKFFDMAEDIRHLVAFVKYNDDEGKGKISDLFREAQVFFKKGNLENTLQNLIESVMINKEYANELPRKSIISIFHLLGDKHEITRKYRKRFDMALY